MQVGKKIIQRREIVVGEREVTDQEADWPEDEEDEEGGEKIEEVSETNKQEPAKSSEPVKVGNFYLYF